LGVLANKFDFVLRFLLMTLRTLTKHLTLIFTLLTLLFIRPIEVSAENILDFANNISAPRSNFDVVSILSRIALLILLIGIYWIILNRTRKSLKVWIPTNQRLRLITDLTLTIGTVFLSFLTVVFTFNDHLGGFFTILGLISTALVFTLQDFVASFFGWFQIKLGNLYMTGDEITVHTGTAKYTGKVVHTGIFRTLIKIRRGDGTLDQEQFTGKVVSFPNHLVLKDGVDNSTKTNRILWHSYGCTITFESDVHKAKGLLQIIADKQFQYGLDHNQIVAPSPHRKHIYKPKIYLDIANDGNRFTIWFASNIESYREIVDTLSFTILDEFAANGIKMAYPTQRILIDK
jgi:small-conductance mechanosensitive channel